MPPGCKWRSNSRSRQCRIIFGSGIFTGHTLSHLPQNVLAFGKCPDLSTPISEGVSTLPIGPGYTQPYACPPTAPNTGQWFMHAAQRMQRSIS